MRRKSAIGMIDRVVLDFRVFFMFVGYPRQVFVFNNSWNIFAS